MLITLSQDSDYFILKSSEFIIQIKSCNDVSLIEITAKNNKNLEEDEFVNLMNSKFTDIFSDKLISFNLTKEFKIINQKIYIKSLLIRLELGREVPISEIYKVRDQFNDPDYIKNPYNQLLSRWKTNQ